MKVTIDLSDMEFDFIKKEAEKNNITVEEYSRDKILRDNIFEIYYKEILEKIEKLNNNTMFSIKLLLGVDWLNIPKGIKLSLGRKFYKNVMEGKYENIIFLHKDAGSTTFYKKI